MSYVNVKEPLKLSAWTGSHYESRKWILYITNNSMAIYLIFLLIAPNYSKLSLLLIPCGNIILNVLCNKVTQPYLKNCRNYSLSPQKILGTHMKKRNWYTQPAGIEKHVLNMFKVKNNYTNYKWSRVCLCMRVYVEGWILTDKWTQTKTNTHITREHTTQSPSQQTPT